MGPSKAVFRRMILGRLYDHLNTNYSFAWPRDLFLDARPPFHDVDAILSFKSDIHIDALRSALDRLDEGNYGVCLHCKMEIPFELLDVDPIRRFCISCEKEFSLLSTNHSPSTRVSSNA